MLSSCFSVSLSFSSAGVTRQLTSLLSVYGSYLVFQLFSHKDLYDDANPDVYKSTQYAPHRTAKQWRHDRTEMKAIKKRQKEEPGYQPEPHAAEEDVETAPAPEVDEEEQPKMGVYMTVGLLVVVTVVRSRVWRLIRVSTLGLTRRISWLL